MSGRNGTGPMGQGAMSGRGLGYCTGVNAGGVFGAGMGRSFGCGMGCGKGLGYGFKRGFGEPYVGQFSGLTQKDMLTEQRELLKRRLDAINKQLDDQSVSD